MTNAELISKIKAEIERLKSNMDDRDPLAPNQKAGYLFALADVLSFLSTIESEKPIIPNDLEEVAIEYAKAYTENDNGNGGDDWEDDIKITFIAGAKWQEEKNQETIKLAEDHAFLAGADWQKEHTPLPEDTVLFKKGVEEGKRLMMEEAEDAEVESFSDNMHPEISIPLNPTMIKVGDKVRIIILPKED